MSSVPSELPEDVDALKALVQDQAQALAERDTRIESLNEHIRILLARRFGASSERVDDTQLGLFNEAEVEAREAEADVVEVPRHTRRRGGRERLPAHLPREEIVYELPEAERVCPHDATVLEAFAEATSEQLDIVPAKVRVLVHRRVKYRCPCCGEHVVTAPMAPQPIPKSQASPGLLAYVATSKYVDALPLYRQSKQLERLGVRIPRQRLAVWMVRSGELVQPLINLLRDRLVEGAYIQMDETSVQVLDEPGRAPETKSYLWAQRSGETQRPVILFDYDPSRSGAVPRRLLGAFSGYLQTDGYEGYNAIARETGLTRVYCFAHVRRQFTDALKALGLNPRKLPDKAPDKARRALRGLSFIRNLYAIEHRARGEPPDERKRIRDHHSRPVLDTLHAWVEANRPKVAPSTPLGKALAYLHRHWDGLVVFLQDGRLEIDNNRVENAIRPFVVGRKNWLFSATVAGAHASANLYSLIETAKANGLEPYAYLRYLFTELPKADTVKVIEALLPYNLDPAAITL